MSVLYKQWLLRVFGVTSTSIYFSQLPLLTNKGSGDEDASKTEMAADPLLFGRSTPLGVTQSTRKERRVRRALVARRAARVERFEDIDLDDETTMEKSIAERPHVKSQGLHISIPMLVHFLIPCRLLTP